ncbi:MULTISPECIES: biopolymer transporter ExbD [unclassified Caballeronia]|uniref:ExbD/TolR family protein n=1 Tax=unclassified Caballeronia TaxID=2646786 RepID=UPI00285FF132|nr:MULTISPECIES: biopolymer transporter ExbD [unclassified Caballeronia]MDR5814443.1 biopolymer transporter ExbD [Caballeronia sp. LZ033]MDR5820922.1 biopolymer transporter ExbD [Caballeronia sp. LZ043]MDR5879075.1 biopolymer transporter ExbD [Caballeronia sp. LZ032]
MAFGGLDKHANGQPMAEINMTPLIDVMLVLLVIFIITAPLFTHAIRLDLPKVSSQPARETPQTITLSIDDTGKLYWNDTLIGVEQMRARFVEAGRAAQKPELHLRASSATRYDVIAQVMGAAQQAGIERIGFVTQPAQQSAR